MALFVKICGMLCAEDAERVSVLEPDAVGFILWPRSRRYVDPRKVGDWQTAGSVQRVGVFVDAAPEDVAVAVERARLDIVQLHGSEDPSEYCGVGARLWKALHLDGARPPAPSAEGLDAVLLDSRTAQMPGGTGRVCDWDAAADFVAASGRKVLLAGGLTPDNVAAAAEHVHPWGVDVSSGVEDDAGRKRIDLVEEFILRCRRMK